MDCWTKVPLLVCVDRIVDGLGINLIEIIMNALLKSGGLIKEELSMKLLCLGLMGWMYFKGAK
jgi:hypothetical protein